jgi:hypothetical protein
MFELSGAFNGGQNPNIIKIEKESKLLSLKKLVEEARDIFETIETVEASDQYKIQEWLRNAARAIIVASAN